MVNLAYPIAFPLASFLCLWWFSPRLSKSVIKAVGTLGIALSAFYSLYLAWHLFEQPNVHQVLWTWIPAQQAQYESIAFGLHGDALSLLMCVVVSFVSLLIAVYSTEFMADETGFGRFFSQVNLFVSSMLLLVLADNLLLLFMGWEGVGLCSYLLIGFYFKEPKAGAAAFKAFITTRIGDAFLLLGIIICFILFRTVQIQDILSQATFFWPQSSLWITLAAFCLIAGAVGKSAQLPLQTWLADAMWGPTPVSALIHAATMVTAGVYLIARMAALLSLAPLAQLALVVIGGFTLLLGALAALVQTDMKRVLAYSTMSQIGYMFLALGIGAYSAAIFHLATHAFFKALLFLAAGVIGHALHHNYNLFHMGGLFRKMPAVFILFLIGSLNLIGLPFVTAGYFSKEWILDQALSLPVIGFYAWTIGVFGVFLTGLYTFRMFALAFLGSPKQAVHPHAHWPMMLPLYILAFFSLVIGWLQMPSFVGPITFIEDWLYPVLPGLQHLVSEESRYVLFTPSLLAVIGALVSLLVYGRYRLAFKKEPSDFWLAALLRSGGGFNWLYNRLIVEPYALLARKMKKDWVEILLRGLGHSLGLAHGFLNTLHGANLAHMVSFFALAALVMTGVMVFS